MSQLILTCNVTGKTVVWTNKTIIDRKIKEYGSLEAFKAAYVSRNALKTSKGTTTTTTKPLSAMSIPSDGNVGLMKAILQDGIKLSPKGLSTKHLTNEEYVKMYEEKIAALVSANAPQSEINWMMQRLDRWRKA